jgi:gamma-glutamyltranspeptidase/glutathione hydrolase
MARIAAAFLSVGFVLGCVVLNGLNLNDAAAAELKSAGKPASAVGLSRETWLKTPDPWTGEPVQEINGRLRPAVSAGGMVAADDAEAAEWGAEILRQGGNAIDAAVATGFAMSVSRPQYAALGGGGFLVYCPAPDQKASLKKTDWKKPDCVSLDFRETAPGAAHRDLYIRNGKADPALSRDGALAVGVPGVPGGLLAALEKLGTLKRDRVLKKPIEMAEKGIKTSGHTEALLHSRSKAFNPEALRIFSCGGREAMSLCRVGQKLVQPDLGRVLREISKQGAPGFYRSWVSKKIVEGVKKGGGILETNDFEKYQPVWRTPVSATRFGYEFVSMGPPSSGGTVLLQMLKYAELSDEKGWLDLGYGSADSVHAISQGMVLAFADRADFFGDADFVKVPLAGLLSDDYLKKQFEKHFNRERLSLPDGPGQVDVHSGNTTHFSVIDKKGNAVAITMTVNEDFGSAFVSPGTGVVLNNQMDDFSAQPGVPNLYGLVGGEANAIAPFKRPLSSMSPTIVRDREGRVKFSIGGQGGPKIVTGVFQALLNRIRFQMNLPDAVTALRFHHQWKPPVLQVENPGWSFDTLKALESRGHLFKLVEYSGKLHALERFENGRVWGVSDPRTEGAAVGE